jgi:hypothetical protein
VIAAGVRCPARAERRFTGAAPMTPAERRRARPAEGKGVAPLRLVLGDGCE